MSEPSNLMLHAGGRLCTLDELKAAPTPKAEGIWHPVSHAQVLETVTRTLADAGYAIKKQTLAIARHGARVFGTIDLTTSLTDDDSVALAVGVRNSTDKSYPRLVVMWGWSETSCCCHPIVLRNAP